MHRIVLEVNVEGRDSWQGILNNIANLRKALGEEQTQIEAVFHGKGVGMLLPGDPGMMERLAQLVAGGVVLAACENTLRNRNLAQSDLIPGTTTVPAGVAEVVLKQEAGWSYIKGGS